MFSEASCKFGFEQRTKATNHFRIIQEYHIVTSNKIGPDVYKMDTSMEKATQIYTTLIIRLSLRFLATGTPTEI
jgi:hypothetical protein